MARAPETGVFLERKSYRRRRLLDGLRVLPVLAAWLFLLPVLWPRGADAAAPTTSSVLVYVFGVWFALTVLCALFTRAAAGRRRRDGGERL